MPSCLRSSQSPQSSQSHRRLTKRKSCVVGPGTPGASSQAILNLQNDFQQKQTYFCQQKATTQNVEASGTCFYFQTVMNSMNTNHISITCVLLWCFHLGALSAFWGGTSLWFVLWFVGIFFFVLLIVLKLLNGCGQSVNCVFSSALLEVFSIVLVSMLHSTAPPAATVQAAHAEREASCMAMGPQGSAQIISGHKVFWRQKTLRSLIVSCKYLREKDLTTVHHGNSIWKHDSGLRPVAEMFHLGTKRAHE